MSLSPFASLLTLALLATAARAEEGDCYDVPALKDHPDLAIAHVVPAAPRTFFVKNAAEAQDCPSNTEACRAKAFLVPGDRVVVGSARHGFACAVYRSPKGMERGGWLPEAALQRESPLPVLPEDWLGTWLRDEATITIEPKGRQLLIAGQATFGSHDPERVKRGAVNVGELDATVSPNGPDLAFTYGIDGTLPVDKGQESDCRVWMRRLGPYLLVDDNNQCGGLNVSFSGTYARKP